MLVATGNYFADQTTMARSPGVLKTAVAILVVSFCVSCGSSQPSSAPSSSHGSGPTYVICFSNPNARVVSLSGAFPVTAATQVQALEEPWAKEFRRYLGQRNGKEDGISVTCTPVSPQNAQGELKDRADSLRKAGHEVTETGWVYAGG